MLIVRQDNRIEQQTYPHVTSAAPPSPDGPAEILQFLPREMEKVSLHIVTAYMTSGLVREINDNSAHSFRSCLAKTARSTCRAFVGGFRRVKLSAEGLCSGPGCSGPCQRLTEARRTPDRKTWHGIGVDTYVVCSPIENSRSTIEARCSGPPWISLVMRNSLAWLCPDSRTGRRW